MYHAHQNPRTMFGYRAPHLGFTIGSGEEAVELTAEMVQIVHNNSKDESESLKRWLAEAHAATPSVTDVRTLSTQLDSVLAKLTDAIGDAATFAARFTANESNIQATCGNLVVAAVGLSKQYDALDTSVDFQKKPSPLPTEAQIRAALQSTKELVELCKTALARNTGMSDANKTSLKSLQSDAEALVIAFMGINADEATQAQIRENALAFIKLLADSDALSKRYADLVATGVVSVGQEKTAGADAKAADKAAADKGGRVGIYLLVGSVLGMAAAIYMSRDKKASSDSRGAKSLDSDFEPVARAARDSRGSDMSVGSSRGLGSDGRPTWSSKVSRGYSQPRSSRRP